MLTASKLLMSEPWDCIFQHLLESKACPEGGLKSTHNVFSLSKYADQKNQNSCSQLQNSGCQGLRTTFSDIILSLRLASRQGTDNAINVF